MECHQNTEEEKGCENRSSRRGGVEIALRATRPSSLGPWYEGTGKRTGRLNRVYCTFYTGCSVACMHV